ncbi:MAG: hypothetical protein FI734_03795 [SAR202 cluster bacterium]|nr:hypothetical protein [SAR202 cluster bacterium]
MDLAWFWYCHCFPCLCEKKQRARDPRSTRMTKMVSEMMGDHVLMFGSDYPHAESRFPKSADIVLDWDSLGEERMRRLMWDNAAKCFRL